MGSSSATYSWVIILIFVAKGSKSCSCRRNLIFRGLTGGSTSVSVSACLFRLGCSFPCYEVLPSFHLGVCLARSCYRFEGLLGVVSVTRTRFLVLTGSTGGAKRVSH